MFTMPSDDWGMIAHSEQWIGLCDKDGTEIYVGDIIESPSGSREVIVFENGSFLHKDYWTTTEGCGGSCWVNRKHIESCKVVGNIGDVFYHTKKGKK